VKFNVLGPLEVDLGGQLVHPRGQVGRLLLSLLCRADRVVTIDRLAEDVWATETPPATARAAIHVHISKLRRLLGRVTTPAATIETEGTGYVLRLGSAEIDATTFRTELADGRALLDDGHPGRAFERLTAALSLWRGPALSGYECEPGMMAWAAELESLRHQAEEDRVAAAVACVDADAVTEARRLVDAEPLRERRWELLMLVLYRSGRQAEALRAYQEARAVLLDQVGIEPGRELQLLEHAILIQDPALDVDGTAAKRPAPPPRIPGALAPLVDRDEERRTLPPADAHDAAIGRYAAARLFEACVRAAVPGFSVADDADAVARICRRVDGLPLALELVAAWARVLGVAQIANELDQRLLPLVAAPGPGGDGRYVTMTATIDAAYQRLDPSERRVMRRLAPFTGGFDVAAVNAVAGDGGLLGLARLVETSLVEAAPEQGRYRMLEPIRQFALTAPDDTGAHVDAHAGHALFICELAEAADATQRGSGQKEALDRLDANLDNLRAALTWSIEHDPQLALRLVIALRWFWEVRGHWPEGVRWCDAALAAQPDDGRSALLAHAMVKRVEAGVTFAAMADNLPLAERAPAMARETAAPCVVANACMAVAIGLGWRGDDLDRAEALMAEAMATAVDEGDRAAEAWVARFQGLLLLRRGDAAGAYERQQWSLAIAEQVGDECGVGHGQVFLGRTAFLIGDLERARVNLAEGTRRCRELGSFTFVHGLLGLAQVEHAMGDLDHAEPRFREAVAVTERIGDLGCSAVAWRGLGSIARSRGDHDTALARLRRALVIFGRLEHTSDAAGALIDVAGLASAAGDHRRAARLVGAAIELDHGAGTPLAPADVDASAELLAEAGRMLGEIERDRWVAGGRRLTLDRALAEVLDPSLLRRPAASVRGPRAA
jgi:DNA-binding SARP family transcriptional activator